MADGYAGPKLDCDIVMKGGITSGVVYPGAAARLAREYRFRAIGGTSAGAIAAAVVAAAEHRRRRGSTDGFAAVAALDDVLAGPEGGEPLLLGLFQPDPGTRGLFGVMLGFMKGGPVGGLARTMRAFPRFPLLAALIVVAAVVARVADAIGTGWLVAALLAAVIVMVAGLVVDVVRAVLALPRNGLGVCSLGPGSVGSGPALTAWLHEQIQTVAGRAVDGPVLTFADLWGVTATDPEARAAEVRARSVDAALREVDLQVMTTDLTHGRPWRLPAPRQRYADALEFGGELLFRPDELARFFPAEVVEHMSACGAPISADRARHLPDGGAAFRRFPAGCDLPVLVATRMSLSFPGLICPIPLWNLDFAGGDESVRLERVVFSDGGITSNFPVHFFDAPLPTRPTFGLHLTTFPDGVAPPVGVGEQGRAVVAPADPAAQAPEEPRTIVSLGQFLVAIKDAMQNWRDNTQARQPGFRDRMVHIQLGPGEGGMTLTMNRDKVLDLSARGGAAADVLVGLFARRSDDAETPWNKHRFVRFRIAAAVTEDYLGSFSRAYDTAPDDGISMAYAARVAAAVPGGPLPYRFVSDAQGARARDAAAAYDRPVPEEPRLQLGFGAPRPPSTLRTVPPV